MGLPGLARDCTLWLDFQSAGFDDQALALFAAEADEFEALLECQVRLGDRENPKDGAWVVSPSGSGEPPSLSWDPGTLTLTSHASGPDQTMDSMQLLHALLRDPQDRPEFRAPRTTREAAQLIRDEVLGSYPYFELRGIDRDQWAGRHAQEAPEDWDAFTTWAQEWVAQLGDAHTAVIARSQRGFNPCYVGSLGSDGIMLEAVPEASAAYAAGVRAGWLVTVEDPLQWLRTTGASPQQHARVAARRALTVTDGQRQFTAHAPNTGQRVSWTEVAAPPSLETVLQVEDPTADVVRVRLSAFYAGLGVEDVFDDLGRGAGPSQVMELDLRGNTGGNLVLAAGLRDRFLREPTHVGSIAFSDGCGGLTTVRQRWAHPSDRPCWPGRLRILTDSMTYSAAEDFILGLQGLEHVTVARETTGGGSGRPLLRPLGPDLTLRVSTAITYDRNGRPVEFLGITPDPH
ncbi:S41 family peptidase [Luteococcus sp.]|uniref:S41 family peptidase n=1 Tax=Luteococcus sp. TaxID=1969402 RepID=UPI003736EDED